MKKISIYFFATFTPIASALAVDFPVASTQPLSKYGEIQNVQNYSSNPFWTKNAPYNQKMPQVIYVQGADLNTSECQSVVSRVVASVCSAKNNCSGTKLDEVKPAIMVQLSNIPGHNYVTACSGFVDSAFNDYVSQYGSAVQNTNFPTAVFPGNNSDENKFKIENPYAPKSPQWHGEEWFGDIVGRTKELNNLQAQNAEDTTLTATKMPETAANLTFKERMDNAKAGYEEWAPVYSTDANGNKVCIKNCSYQGLNVESDEKYLERQRQKNYSNNPTEKKDFDNNNSYKKDTNSNVNHTLNGSQQKQLDDFIEAMKKAKK